jgi:hypothetical protein
VAGPARSVGRTLHALRLPHRILEGPKVAAGSGTHMPDVTLHGRPSKAVRKKLTVSVK